MTDSPPRRAWDAVLSWPAWQRVAAALGLLVLISAVVQLLDRDEPESSYRPPVDFERTVVYELEGSVRYADITMTTPTGIEQVSGDVPLTNRNGDRGLVITGFNSGDFVSISAQKPGEGGSITCRITIDGQVVSENTSTAAYGIASCDGTA
ncbi:hypothetical protein QWY28_13470 [Nocardioides sp. SOB77]|uniref:Uncharacterized protein n=1 Tax=Nocardioides oceani TaxID=3058369 RepID=A0ABT8FHG7_9ACTN|nr:hypothetical protein [Nocardioides oceani]MDN4173965.1 hypothetical protein [Nocardioides oceani]